MTPQYDTYHTLIIPPPARVLTLADLAGEWTNDSKALTNYYSTSTGAHAGYSAIVGTDTWVINPKGTISTKYHGANVSNTHVQAIDSTKQGTIALSSDGVLSIVFKDFPSQTTLYMVRGWFVGADVTMLQINGPWYDTIPDKARPAGQNNYMNNVMVRAK